MQTSLPEGIIHLFMRVDNAIFVYCSLCIACL